MELHVAADYLDAVRKKQLICAIIALLVVGVIVIVIVGVSGGFK